MYEKSVVLLRGFDDLRGTGLHDVAAPLAAHLRLRHVSGVTVETYLRVAAHFAAWLDARRGVPSRTTMRSFLDAHIPRCRCPRRPTHSRIIARAALGHVRAVLRSVGWFDDEAPPRHPIDDEVDGFDAHLRSVCGVSDETRRYRRREVRLLLASTFGDGPVDPHAMTPIRVREYVALRSHSCRPASLAVIGSAVRSYLRFLRFEGRCSDGLVGAVPRVAKWRLASIPVHLTEEELRRFLASFNTHTPRGRRDRAITLCLAVLGLRAIEVAALRLGDVAWRQGQLHVPPTKTRRGRTLPLPEPVGRALALAVRHGRPRSTSDRLFVRIGVLEGEPMSSADVRGAVRAAYTRAGFPAAYTGTHRLRHTAATRLVASGAGVKAVADVLGHASLDSAAIYAKVDLPRLHAVALPWPGWSR
jgi:integrase/recombinase XerD